MPDNEPSFTPDKVQFIDDKEVPVYYSNFATVGSSEEDFIIQFCRRPLREMDATLPVATVYVSRKHAKRLAEVLNIVIKANEADFGMIEVVPTPFNVPIELAVKEN